METAELPKELHRVLDFNGKVEYYPTKKRFLLPFVWDYLHSKIDDNTHYSQAELNSLISSWIVFDDTETVRLDLFDNGYIHGETDGSKYWKVSK